MTLDALLRQRRLPGLDGLRAASVSAVIIYHFAPASGVVPAGIGVTCFFVLSGFLITWLLRREWNETGSVSFRSFYTRRTLRIFPAYYVFLTVMAVLMWAAHRRWPPGQGWAALFYLSDYYSALHPASSSSIAHTWSLAVEEQFYLLWPAALVLLARHGRRRLVLGLSTIVAVVVLWRALLLVGMRVSDAYSYHAFDTRADSLALGCLLAIVLETPLGLRWAGRAAARWWAPLVTVGLLVLVSRLGGSGVTHDIIDPTVQSALCAVLVVQTVQLAATRPWAWLEHPAVVYIGTISYSLYLYHGIPEFVAHRLPLPLFAQIALAIVAAIGLASLSYFAVERPCLKLRRRFAGARASSQATAAAPAPAAH